MLLSTTEVVAGKVIDKTLGLVKGNLRPIEKYWPRYDGRASKYYWGRNERICKKVLVRSREIATHAMQEEAQRLGADAIVSIRFSTSSVLDGTPEVLAYGTAVKLKA